MPFNRPSIGDLSRRISGDVTPRLPGTDPLLRRSVVGAVVRGNAGAFHEAYGYLDWIAKSVFADSAEDAELRRIAGIWGVVPIDAIAARGSIAITGTTGVTVPSGTVWRRGDGVEYASTAEVTLVAGAATAAVQAVEAGRDGNAAVGVTVSLVSPIAGVVSDASVSVAIGAGANEEGDDRLAARLLERIRKPPRGGNVDDYKRWTKAAHSDVTRVWVTPRASGLGTVGIHFMTDDATADGIPDAATVTVVSDYIGADDRKPVTADVTVAAPTAVELDFTIDALIPDTSTVRAAVEAELADLILREAAPGGTIYLTHIAEAISGALGEIDHDLQAPSADVVSNAGEISVMGTVTWA